MKNNTKAKITGVICCILAVFGFVNYWVLIWMARKTKSKKLEIMGWISLVLMFASVIGMDFVSAKSIIFSLCAGISCISILFPSFAVFIYSSEFIRRKTILDTVKKENIDVEHVLVETAETKYGALQKGYEKSSHALYGDKGNAVLCAIHKKEIEAQKKKEYEEREKALQKKRKEAEKMRMEAAKAEAEKARAEAAKAEAKKAQAEAVKAEAEKARAEVAKAEAEKAKAEAEKAKAEVEKAKIEFERKKEEELRKKNNFFRENGNVNGSNKTEIKQVDVNSCSEKELSMIPGIGLILAKKAMGIRESQGLFRSVDDFIEKTGIRYENIENVKKYLLCSNSKEKFSDDSRRHGRRVDF